MDATAWHAYQLDWDSAEVRFWVDGEIKFKTPVSPLGRLGLVLWIDNQFAAFPPDGRLKFGSLDNPEPVWLELSEMSVHKQVQDQPDQQQEAVSAVVIEGGGRKP